MTVALLFNVKGEATKHPAGSSETIHTQQALNSLATSLSQADPLLSSDVHVPAPERTNDLYAEWDTPDTIQAVREALEERHSVVFVEADESAYQKLADLRPDIAFNMAEGLYGVSREAHIPAILEMLRIPYLGSDPQTLAVCLDKARTKEILAYHGIPTASFAVVRTMQEFEDTRVRFPAVVKPLHEGSSKGIYDSSVARTPQELEREVHAVLSVYHQPAILEEFLPGREFTVAILGNGKDARTLPIVEIRFDTLPAGVNPIYSYEAKWVWDQSDNPLDIFECPAKLDQALQSQIGETCLAAYRILNCRDWARIDVRLDGRGRANVLEVNPLPGILPRPEDNSCFPKAARAAGMTYIELINSVLDIALDRNGLTQPSSRKPALAVA